MDGRAGGPGSAIHNINYYMKKETTYLFMKIQDDIESAGIFLKNNGSYTIKSSIFNRSSPLVLNLHDLAIYLLYSCAIFFT